MTCVKVASSVFISRRICSQPISSAGFGGTGGEQVEACHLVMRDQFSISASLISLERIVLRQWRLATPKIECVCGAAHVGVNDEDARARLGEADDRIDDRGGLTFGGYARRDQQGLRNVARRGELDRCVQVAVGFRQR